MGLITVALGRLLQVKIAEPLLWGLCFPGLRSEALFLFQAHRMRLIHLHIALFQVVRKCVQ